MLFSGGFTKNPSFSLNSMWWDPALGNFDGREER